MRKAKQSKWHHGFRPTRSTLDSLLSLMLSDVGGDPRVTIEAQQSISSINADSLNELFVEIEKEPTERIAKLEIAVSSFKNEEISRTSVEFSPTGTYVWVSGPNETWVLGRYGEIVRRLKVTRPKPYIPPVVFSSAWLAVTLGILVPSLLVHGHAQTILAGLAAPLLIVIAPANIWSVRRMRTRLDFVAIQKGWWSADRAISVAGVAAGFIAIAVALWTWANPKS